MTTYNLYTFGQHNLGPPRPCHPSSTQSQPCEHVKDPRSTRKPSFCPLALHVTQHSAWLKPIRIIDPNMPLLQLENKLWFPSLRLDSQMTFYGGRIRPKPGTPAFGLDPIVEGSVEVDCDLLTQGEQIIGVAAGTLQNEPCVALFSNGELRVLRYERAESSDAKDSLGRFWFDKLKTAEVEAVEATGLQYGKEALVGIAQTTAAGPVNLLTENGRVYELPWKDMSSAKQYAGRHTDLSSPIVEISSSWDKIVARTEDGQVWFWQTGQNPVQVDIPGDEEISGIRAGGRLGVALTKKGEAWAWALSRPDIGQEGKTIAGAGGTWLPGPDGKVKASKLKLPAQVDIKTLNIGPAHLAVSTEDGTWYTAGDGRYGQLGLGEKLFELEDNANVERGDEYVRTFSAMDLTDFEGKQVVEVVCGATTTWVVAVDKD